MELSKYKVLNSDNLKVIALISMLIDHIGVVIFARLYQLYPQPEFHNIYNLCRAAGRLAFPIYCFMLVEGKFHTKNIKKYLLRLGIFALISEIPYDLALHNSFIDISSQNVFFTLLIGLIMLTLFELYSNSLWQVGVYIACAGCSYLIKCDYDIYGITLIMAFYILRQEPVVRNLLTGGLLFYQHQAATLAIIPITMYNKIKRKNRLKYLFYLFYPMHLLILYIAANIFIPLR